MSAKAPVDVKPQPKKVMLSSGRGGSGNIRRIKSSKEIVPRPLASPKLIELEPPRNRAAYGGRGGSGNVWTHVIEEGLFDRVLNYEITRARVVIEERAFEKGERRKSGAAGRARSHSDVPPDARSVMSARSRKSWVSTFVQDDCANPRSAGRRKSFANTFLAPLRKSFRASNGARLSAELTHGGSDSGHSAPFSDDQPSPSTITSHLPLSPSTPNLSPSTPVSPLPATRRRWTGSGQREPVPDLARARRHLSSPLPPPTQPIPPLPVAHIRFDPRPPSPPPMPIHIFPDDRSRSPPTPTDDSYALLNAAATAAAKARPFHRRPSKPRSSVAPFPSAPELSSYAWNHGHHAIAHPPPSRAAMYALSHRARIQSSTAIPSATESYMHPVEDSEADLIDPSLLSGSGDDGRCSVRDHHTEVPTVSSLASIVPWLHDHDLDCIIPALSDLSHAD